MTQIFIRFCTCVLMALVAHPATAQTADDHTRPKDGVTAAANPRPLVADAVTKQTLELPGHTLHFTATAGYVRVQDDAGAPEADIAMTGYALDGADPATRPITFVLNGGPGMASAWLQMGAVGPWRIDLVPAPSASAVPQANADTWLDFTDLVFIDPAGTGYSQFVASGDDVRKRLWSVDGDIDSLAQAIRRWLDKSGRGLSPIYLLGESYGGFRAPRLARRLAEHDGIGLRGMVMLSPVLDFGNRSRAFDLFSYADVLPSMAATLRAAHGQPVSRSDLRDAEAYASGPFLSDALRGVADQEAVDRVVERVTALTGLDPTLVRRRRGLVSGWLFAHEHDRSVGRIDSLYDPTVALADPFPEYPDEPDADPMLDGLRPSLTQAMLAVYQTLHWHPEGPTYRLFNEATARQWDFGHGGQKPESFVALRQALAIDPNLHVIIAHGLFDLVCPYYATQLLLNQIPPDSGGDRIRLLAVPGGHMFYSRDESRRSLRAAAAALIGSPKP